MLASLAWAIYVICQSPTDFSSIRDPIIPLGMTIQQPILPSITLLNASFSIMNETSTVPFSECMFSPKPCVFLNALQVVLNQGKNYVSLVVSIDGGSSTKPPPPGSICDPVNPVSSVCTSKLPVVDLGGLSHVVGIE
ncbi:UNVERIFIED_CONTAM: hypothetical protein HDU68_009813, partial [Siphonaria sp. JEL0065]